MNRRRHRRTRCRPAFSLLEVLMAASILVGSLVVLMKLASVGRRHAEDAQRLTEAQALCETTLNELRTGLRPVEAVEAQPLDGAAGWQYSVATQSLPKLGVVEVRVTVQSDSPNRKGPQFTLVHWLRDPETRQPPASAAPTWQAPPGGPAP